MSYMWNINGLCRCCHSEGNFKSINTFSSDGIEEDYLVLLKDTFDVIINPLQSDLSVSYNICGVCEPRLKDAAQFKKQVISCEDKLKQYLFTCQFKDGDILEKEVKTELEQDVYIFSELKPETSTLNDKLDFKYSDDKIQHLDIFLSTEDDDQPLSTLRSNKITQSPEEYRDGGAEWTPPDMTDDEDRQKKTKSKKYSCEICQKKFSYNGSLEVHMKAHNGEKSFTCHLCNTSHTNNKELTKHITITHIVDNQYPCTVCEKVFEKARLLKKHIKCHFEEKFKCSVCFKEFQRKKGLKEHMKIHTGERKYTCDVCNKSFGHNQTLKSHMFTHTGERPYVCDVCGRRFPQRTHLKRHIFIIHTGVKPHTCTVCNKQFSSKSYLAIHERQHTGERPYSCEVCKKDFTAYTTLKVHMRVHTGFKPYTCSFCDRQFAQMASFKLHQRTHTGERPFSCKICKKPFSDNGYLKIHMRVHSGEKPFSCEICKRCFRETGQLKRHMRVHTGIKPYTCKICNKQIGNLSKHMRVHSEERPYSCNVCNKQFSINGNLKLHMRVHSGERPFSCDICNSQFTQSSGLKRHRCTHVGKSDNLNYVVFYIIFGYDAVDNFNFSKLLLFPSISQIKVNVILLTGVKMNEIWNLSTLCRCCHSDGCFKSLNLPYQGENGFEIYERILEETYNVKISTPPIEASYTICDECIKKLKDAARFRTQVLACEQRFHIYCNNEQFLEANEIKAEVVDLEDNVDDCSNNDDSQNLYSLPHSDELDAEELKEKREVEDNDDLVKKEIKTEIELTPIMENIGDVQHLKREDVDVKSTPKIVISTLQSPKSTPKSTKGTPSSTESTPSITESAQKSTKSAPKRTKSALKIAKSALKSTKSALKSTKSALKSTKSTTSNPSSTESAPKSTNSATKVKYNFDQHITFDKESEKYSCNQCLKEFKSLKNMLSHCIEKHDVLPYECTYCDKKYRMKKQVVKHVNTVHAVQGKETYKCSFCNKKFIEKAKLVEHEFRHTNAGKFQCDICNRVLKSKVALTNHLWYIHYGVKLKNQVLCDICGHSFNDKTNLNIHIRSVHLKEKPFTCPICNKHYSAKKHVKDHIKTVHNKNRQTETKPEKSFQCELCSKTFAAKRFLVIHLERHDNIFRCRRCDVCFSNKNDYNLHTINCIKNGKVNFSTCDVCGKIFRTKYTMRRHKLSVHNGIKYDCELCGKKFSHSSIIQRHKIRIHGEPKPPKTKCGICNKSFYNMKKHMYVHDSSLRKYTCDLCGKGYAENNTLNRHKAEKHFGRRFTCECGKSYLKKRALAFHKSKVHGIKFEKNDDEKTFEVPIV
ncbi:uncharacterized protein LOC142984743 [Anticarsia gemmatalis]|uniref:uncharacterized protein LOC142984743 n=1 Tax=Anticarsia gemmatalis TaxID=129554 RepID=UPI003F75D9FC